MFPDRSAARRLVLLLSLPLAAAAAPRPIPLIEGRASTLYVEAVVEGAGTRQFRGDTGSTYSTIAGHTIRGLREQGRALPAPRSPTAAAGACPFTPSTAWISPGAAASRTCGSPSCRGGTARASTPVPCGRRAPFDVRREIGRSLIRPGMAAIHAAAPLLAIVAEVGRRDRCG